jgi:hypothetical protein
MGGKDKEGRYHGKGHLVYSDKSIYKGSFEHGKRDGFGVEIIKGQTYEGKWDKDAKNGEGKLIFDSKEIYQGNW